MSIESLNSITEKARFLSQLNVIDVFFDDDIVMEMYIALEDQDRATGLSGLSSIDTDGMLFCYSQPTTASYTMEGMLIDLDIAFYNEFGKMIHIGRYEKNHSEPIHPWPMKSYSYVVEAPAGTLVPNDLKVKYGT